MSLIYIVKDINLCHSSERLRIAAILRPMINQLSETENRRKNDPCCDITSGIGAELHCDLQTLGWKDRQT